MSCIVVKLIGFIILAHWRRGGPLPRDVVLFVHVRDFQPRADRLQAQRIFRGIRGGQQPAIIRLSNIQVRVHPFRSQQKIFAQGLNRLIVLEFPAAIVSLRRGRKHLDDDIGIQQRVGYIVKELRGAANHGNVRICIQAAGFHPDTHVAGINAASPSPELLVQPGQHIRGDQDYALTARPTWRTSGR
jgi:hypothetical protein